MFNLMFNFGRFAENIAGHDRARNTIQIASSIQFIEKIQSLQIFDRH